MSEGNNFSVDISEGKNKRKSELVEWTEAIIIALVIAFIIRAFVFQLIVVSGPSMNYTLTEGDRLIVYKFGYIMSKPQPGDIIVFQHQPGPFKALPFLFEIDYIKRVIAVEGQSVDIKDGKVYVDGEEQEEPYVHDRTYHQGDETMQYPVVVPEGKVFVLGDNRTNSRDSRYGDVGFVDLKTVKGKAVYRIWPFKQLGVVK